MKMQSKYLITILMATFLVAWKDAPTPTDLRSLVDKPERFAGKEVEITAHVSENQAPTGREYKRWSFLVENGESSLEVYENGFNPATIVDGYRLVEEARLTGDPVTVTGRLRVDKQPMSLQLDSVRYGETRVDTDAGPFVQTYFADCYPGTPLFYDGYMYYPGEFPY
ncbi:MAG: hypothetical protein Kow0099_07660 [Candidatus Abyssubacteria bacterium]